MSTTAIERYFQTVKKKAHWITLCIYVILVMGCADTKNPKNEWHTQTCKAPNTDILGDNRSQRATMSIEKALAGDRGAGISAAVMIDGEIVWNHAVGHADSGANGKLTTKARMRLGSIAKPLTAALALKLHEADILNIDAPIQEYVPSFPEKSGTITIRQLASHTAGIRQYDFSSLSDSNNDIQYDKLEDALSLFADDPLVGRPGEQFHYSSLGYNLIGAAIENATGKPFDEMMSSQLTRPLGLVDTMSDNPSRFIECRPKFYTVVFGRIRIPTFWRNHSDSYPSAGMLSTAEDLVSFANAVFLSDFYRPAEQKLFTTAETLKDGTKINRSFGWEIKLDNQGSVEWIGHGGVTNGAHASLRYYPENNMIIAGISNYNFWLTSQRLQFFRAIREELPLIFNESTG